MRRFLLYFSYIGTGFRGVQRLIPRDVKRVNVAPAVTEVIESALKTRLNLEKLPILHTASRTDAGVHALRTCASVDLDVPKLPPDAITVTLNHYFEKLQCPIRILSTQVVRRDFNCRGLPLYRSYLYRFAVRRADSGFKSDFSFTYLVPTPIQEYKRCHFVHDSDFNIEAVQSVLPLFNGTKDFASFMSKIKGRREDPPLTTIRRLDSVKVDRGQPLMPGFYTDQYFDYWQVEIVGKSFLYKQVRRTVAVLLGVGQGLINYQDVESLFLNPGTWVQHVRSVPAYGLYLTNIVFDEKDLKEPKEKETKGEVIGEEVLEEEEEEERDRREERSTIKVESAVNNNSDVKATPASLKSTSDPEVTTNLKDSPDLEVTSNLKTNPFLKDTKKQSINQKINLRLEKLREQQSCAEGLKSVNRKLSTRYAISLAKSKFAKGLKEGS